MIRTIVIVALLLILVALGSALFFLVRDKGQTERTATALTIRIALSLLLFIGLLIGLYYGVLSPTHLP